MRNFNLPVLRAGLGLREPYLGELLSCPKPCEWLEVIPENFLFHAATWANQLRELREKYSFVAHCVSLSVGSVDPLNMTFLMQLKNFLDEYDIPWVSDHLCFTSTGHHDLEDLVPLPFTSEAVKNVAQRVRVIQDYLERPFLLENITHYFQLPSELTETEFINAVLSEARCGLLLDVTNVILNSQIDRFDPLEFIRALNLERVGQIHLSGWSERSDGEVVDSHDASVPEVVWDLLSKTLELTGPTSILIERDLDLPPFATLIDEVTYVQGLIQEHAGGK